MKLTGTFSAECLNHRMLFILTHTAPLRVDCLSQVGHYHWVCVETIVPYGTDAMPAKINILFINSPIHHDRLYLAAIFSITFFIPVMLVVHINDHSELFILTIVTYSQ